MAISCCGVRCINFVTRQSLACRRKAGNVAEIFEIEPKASHLKL
jgi:hypothetical protein